MIYRGLVSVTFRELTPLQIILAASSAELVGIEWGGDVHVPAGEIETATQVAKLTRDAGLKVSAYGSYYRLGSGAGDTAAAVIDSAAALQAPIIRVWAGTTGSAETNAADREHIVDDARKFCDLAHSAGIRVATEWHGGTLTDTAASALSLFKAIDHPNLFTFWQAPQRKHPDDCLTELKVILPLLVGVHVFQWHAQTTQRQPLSEGAGCWPRFLAEASRSADMFASLEFVRGDSTEQLTHDAATLKLWIDQACVQSKEKS